MSDWLTGVKVPPLRISDIRRVANVIRSCWKIDYNQAIPVVETLEFLMPQGFPNFGWGIFDDIPSHLEACAYPDGCIENPSGPLIKLREHVYNLACQGDGRARFTVLHEIGHIFLHQKVAVHPRGGIGIELAVYENSEWQANLFAAELLMPPESFLDLPSAETYCARMKVSRQAASLRARKLRDRKEIPNLTWATR